jgi:hypothetical protein
MGVAASAKLLAAGAAWRLTGLPPAGNALVGAVVDGAESEQALAGILLVKAGDRSVPLVRDSISRGARAPELVDVLASIGTGAARSALERLAAAASGEMAAAAEQAVATLDEIRRHEQ